MNTNDYLEEIQKLKESKKILILAHYYVEPAIQEVADAVGDSYYLSQISLQAKEQTILFCGVKFMAESAKILSPSKTILIPDNSADCPMAHMITADEIKEARKNYKDIAVVCYINSTSEIKALSDVCVTSANAVTIVNNLKEKNIFFVPDKNLGQYVANQLPHKNFIFSKGFCYVHNDITKDHLVQKLSHIPDAQVVAHPECTFDILELSDFVGSTSAILDYVKQSSHNKFIVCTEVGILYQLIKSNPDKHFYIANDQQVCSNMKKITLENIYHCILSLEPEINVDENIRKKAEKSLEKMHTLALL